MNINSIIEKYYNKMNKTINRDKFICYFFAVIQEYSSFLTDSILLSEIDLKVRQIMIIS